MKRSSSALLAVLLGLGASSCFLDTEPPRRRIVVERSLPPSMPGTLRLRWSISGRMDPNECIKALASTLEVSIADQSGREVGAWQQPCGYFTMDVVLQPGHYTGSALLLDSAARARTTSVFVDPFVIYGGDVIDIQVDFPASSFR